MSRSPPLYAKQDSDQSLREALEEYYGRNPNLLDPDALSVDAKTLFRPHDVTHVVFGCDTSLRGETLVDTWTIFGTTAGLSGYLQYFKYPQVNAIFADIGALRIAAELFRALPDIIRVVRAALRVKP